MQFYLRFLIKFFEIWAMMCRCHFHYNFPSLSLKHDLWHIGASSCTIPHQIHWNVTFDGQCHLLYNSVSNLLKYDKWGVAAVSFTMPYQIHWDMTYDVQVPFPTNPDQFIDICLVTHRCHVPIKFIETWLITCRCHFPYKCWSSSLKHDLWRVDAIFSTIPYQILWNLGYDV